MEMKKWCYSCTAPLDMPEFKGIAENLCKFCTDEAGVLKSRNDIQIGIAEWFQSWQPDIDDAKAMKRADSFMKALPAWDQEP